MRAGAGQGPLRAALTTLRCSRFVPAFLRGDAALLQLLQAGDGGPLPGASARLLGPHRPLQVVRSAEPRIGRRGVGSAPAQRRPPRRDAWHSLGRMSREEAMAAYVAEMKKVAQKVTAAAGLRAAPPAGPALSTALPAAADHRHAAPGRDDAGDVPLLRAALRGDPRHAAAPGGLLPTAGR